MITRTRLQVIRKDPPLEVNFVSQEADSLRRQESIWLRDLIDRATKAKAATAGNPPSNSSNSKEAA